MAKVIKLHLKKCFFERKWARSCFFGSPDLPLEYLDIVKDDELFLAQINLEELRKVYNSSLLPNHGILYFFIGLNDYRGIVRHNIHSVYNERYFGRIDFNNEINGIDNYIKEYKIKFEYNKSDDKSFLLDEDFKSPSMLPNDIILLQYNQKYGPKILETEGLIQFVIDRDELIKGNYESVRLLIVRNENI